MIDEIKDVTHTNVTVHGKKEYGTKIVCTFHENKKNPKYDFWCIRVGGVALYFDEATLWQMECKCYQAREDYEALKEIRYKEEELEQADGR